MAERVRKSAGAFYAGLSNFPGISTPVILALMFVLFALDQLDSTHLLFHTLAELFSVFVAAGIFMISWNTRRFTSNRYLIFLGIAFFYIGSFDLLHTLSYRGMSIFVRRDADLPTQLWIAARFLNAASFLIAPLFFSRRLSVRLVHVVYAAVSILLLFSIFEWEIFPVTFREGVGLTPFKVVSEYVIVLLFLASIPLLYRYRKEFDRRIFFYIVGSAVLAVLTEVLFTMYSNLQDITLVFGHLLKVLSFFFLYKAIIETTLWQPYSFLFRNLEDQKEELARQKKLLENAIEALTHPFYIIDAADYRVVKANSAAYTAAGEDSCSTCYAMTHRKDTPCRSDEHPCPLDIVKEAGKPATVEHIHSDRAGNVRYYEIHGYPILDRDGEVVQMIEYSLDVTDRRLAQKRIEEKSRELSRSNEELQQFAYIASHDLQEPLRMVSSYMALLSQRYRGKLDQDADDFIDFAVDGANRMRALINGLLSFSRVGTHAKPSVAVDMNGIVEKTRSNLEILIKETGAEIVTGDLPPVMGDETQILQLFQNLVGNALKFRSESRVRVEIAAERKDGMIEFSVRDNGIGIDEKYFTRIFQIFQRLHTREEYAGTGIGLTICKKIVERHGGSIRLASKVGEGTEFFFTLPPASEG